jgi:hypothetical protein
VISPTIFFAEKTAGVSERILGKRRRPVEEPVTCQVFVNDLLKNPDTVLPNLFEVFGDPRPVCERALVGARLKVQAKAKLDQISVGLAPRESVVQDMRLEVWSRSIEGSHN